MTHREKIGCMAADGSPIDLSEAMIFEWDIEQDRITCTQSNGVEVCIRDVCFDTDQADSTFLRIHPEDIPALAEFRNRVRQGNLYSMSEFRWKDSEERYTWCRIYAIIRMTDRKSLSRQLEVSGIFRRRNKEYRNCGIGQKKML